MVVGYVSGLLFLLGLVQGVHIPESPTYRESLRDASSTRVVGGWPAHETQIPYQASLRMLGHFGAVIGCGGSLIHHRWILTAAHCVSNRVYFVVTLGSTNNTRPLYIVEATRKYMHPDYIELLANVQTDDIGLIGLEHEIPYGPTIQPCRLQSSEQKNINYSGKQLVVSGYGRTDDLWNGGTTSEILLWTFLRGISNDECLGWYVNSQVIKDQTMCTIYYNETSQSSCQGDSGGPLTIVDADGQPTMVGIVSFGASAGCNSPWPSGYVRPGHYHDWLYEVTGINFDWKAEDLLKKPIQLNNENAKRVNFDNI